jgi:hypothetical protein
MIALHRRTGTICILIVAALVVAASLPAWSVAADKKRLDKNDKQLLPTNTTTTRRTGPRMRTANKSST